MIVQNETLVGPTPLIKVLLFGEVVVDQQLALEELDLFRVFLLHSKLESYCKPL